MKARATRKDTTKDEKDKEKEKDAQYLAMRKRFQKVQKVHEAMETMRHYSGDRLHQTVVKMHNQDKLRLQRQLERNLSDVKDRYDRIRAETEKKTNEKAEAIRTQIIDKLSKLRTRLINQKSLCFTFLIFSCE